MFFLLFAFKSWKQLLEIVVKHTLRFSILSSCHCSRNMSFLHLFFLFIIWYVVLWWASACNYVWPCGAFFSSLVLSIDFVFVFFIELLKCKKSLINNLLRKQLRLKEEAQWKQLRILVDHQSRFLELFFLDWLVSLYLMLIISYHSDLGIRILSNCHEFFHMSLSLKGMLCIKWWWSNNYSLQKIYNCNSLV